MHLKVSQILPQTGMHQPSKKDPAGWDNHHAIEFLEEEVCAGLIPEIDGDNSWPLHSLRRQLGAKERGHGLKTTTENQTQRWRSM